jgi:hypothetical protein
MSNTLAHEPTEVLFPDGGFYDTILSRRDLDARITSQRREEPEIGNGPGIPRYGMGNGRWIRW